MNAEQKEFQRVACRLGYSQGKLDDCSDYGNLYDDPILSDMWEAFKAGVEFGKDKRNE